MGTASLAPCSAGTGCGGNDAGSWNVLSQSPVVSTLVVSVVEATGTVVLTEDQYVYSDTMNAVAVLPSGYMLTEDSVIEVSYTPMPI